MRNKCEGRPFGPTFETGGTAASYTQEILKMMSFEFCFQDISVALKPIAVQDTPSLSLSPSRKTCGVHEERTHASLATKVEVF